MAPKDFLLWEVLLKEYERLKEEQAQRIGTRDNLIYATLLSLAAIIAATVPAGYTTALMFIPPVCFVLGWVNVVNDVKVSTIGRYVRTEIAPQLQALAGQPVLRWEHIHRADALRTSRKRLQLIVNLTIFVLPSWTGLAIYLTFGKPTALTLVITAVELLSSLILGREIFRYADLAKELDVSQPELGAAQ